MVNLWLFMFVGEAHCGWCMYSLVLVSGIWRSDSAINICGSVFVWYYVVEVALRVWAFGPVEYIRFADYNDDTIDGHAPATAPDEPEKGDANLAANNIRARKFGSMVCDLCLLCMCERSARW